MSGGNFTIRIEGAEKTKAAFGVLDMVKGGQFRDGPFRFLLLEGQRHDPGLLHHRPLRDECRRTKRLVLLWRRHAS